MSTLHKAPQINFSLVRSYQ